MSARHVIAFGAIAAGGAALLWWGGRRWGSRLGDVEGAKESLSTMPKGRWWRKVPRADKLCYRTKTEALSKFLDENTHVSEAYGGVGYEQSPAEFDSVNRRYGLEDKMRARSIAEAAWVALPPPAPSKRGRSDSFCLTDIDIDALNDTSPGRNHHLGFRLPDYVFEKEQVEKEAEHHRRYAMVPDLEPVPF